MCLTARGGKMENTVRVYPIVLSNKSNQLQLNIEIARGAITSLPIEYIDFDDDPKKVIQRVQRRYALSDDEKRLLAKRISAAQALARNPIRRK